MTHPFLSYESCPWRRNYEPGVPVNVFYKEKTLLDFFNETVARFPGKTALIFEDYEISYGQLRDMVELMAGALSGLGIKKGDRVAILLPNVIPCVVAYYAVLKLGGIVVMNNPLYTDHELAYQFNDSGARMVITLDLLANRMIALRTKTGIEHIVYTSLGDYLPPLKRRLFPLVARFKKLSARVPSEEKVYRWKRLLSENHPPPPRVDLKQDTPAMYQYTGGTTGISKGVVLSHGNLSRQIQQIDAWFPGFENGKGMMLGALPFFHVFGLTTSMNLAIFYGWGNILVPKPHPVPLIKAISAHRATFVPMVPTMYIGMLNHPDFNKADLSSVEGCFSGSAPLPVEVIKEFEEKTGSIIVEGYGLTETSPVTHINPYAGGGRKVGSIGMPIPDTECRIVDAVNGKAEISMGEPGELMIRGPQVMSSYWNRPDETAAALTPDGWLYTGDIATMDEDGFFFIVDRKKDMVLSGGYNVYPRDIEEVLFMHTDIQEAAVIGIPDPKYGEAVKAFVVLKSGATATRESIIDFCRQRLAKYKVPVDIEFRDELPKSNIGKVLKKELRGEQQEKM
jgi:long-chain acyl-CoA synthetase